MGWLWGDDERLLTPREEALIGRAFRTATLPMLSRIRIRNGLSPNGTPFTTPRTKVVVQKGIPFETEGDYLIMGGQRLFDGDVAIDEPSTLVHEMTHVWQYRQGTLTEFHAVSAHVHYYLRGAAGTVVDSAARKMVGWTGGRVGAKYEDLYDYEIGESWNDMGFEGQAQLVEDWYRLDNMSETSDRWVYVKNVVLEGDRVARSLTLGELRLRSPDLPQEPYVDIRHVAFEEIQFSDDYVLRLLKQDIPPSDVAGLAARVTALEIYFRRLKKHRPGDAVIMAGRLKSQRPGDKLAQAFHFRLSTPTRDRLVKVLQGLA